jgi:hypothetical protein
MRDIAFLADCELVFYLQLAQVGLLGDTLPFISGGVLNNVSLSSLCRAELSFFKRGPRGTADTIDTYSKGLFRAYYCDAAPLDRTLPRSLKLKD